VALIIDKLSNFLYSVLGSISDKGVCMKTKLVFAVVLLVTYFIVWFTHQPSQMKQADALAQLGPHSAAIAPDYAMLYLNWGWVPLLVIVAVLIWSALKSVVSVEVN
jgi:hypothetical protein